MDRKKVFLIVQAILCALTAGLLAAAALCIWFDGSAKKAAGDLFYNIYTREKAGQVLVHLMPLIFSALGMSIAGWILGIRDETADRPAQIDMEELAGIREKAVRQQADRKTLTVRTAVLVIAVVMIILGILNGGLEDVLAKGAAICTECVGLG